MLPIYDKPMIYYSLSTLMLAEIRKILTISTSKDLYRCQRGIWNGNDLGLNIEYEIQEKPNGLAEAFAIGEEFIGNDPVALILGDNIFYGEGLSELLMKSKNRFKKLKCFNFCILSS